MKLDSIILHCLVFIATHVPIALSSSSSSSSCDFPLHFWDLEGPEVCCVQQAAVVVVHSVHRVHHFVHSSLARLYRLP